MRSGRTASWAVPANTSTLIATACACVRPALTIATPATTPQGTMPTRSAAEARAPLRSAESCSRGIFRLDEPVARIKPISRGNSARHGIHDTQRAPSDSTEWACDKGPTRAVAQDNKTAIASLRNLDKLRKNTGRRRVFRFPRQDAFDGNAGSGKICGNTQKGGGPHEHIRVHANSRHHFGGACACRMSREKEQTSRRRRWQRRRPELLRERPRRLEYKSRDAGLTVQD